MMQQTPPIMSEGDRYQAATTHLLLKQSLLLLRSAHFFTLLLYLEWSRLRWLCSSAACQCRHVANEATSVKRTPFRMMDVLRSQVVRKSW